MTNDARRRLELVLDREIDVARQLAATLEAEREALTGNSPTAVAEKAAQKIALLGTFAGLEGERRSLAEPPFSQVSDVAAQRWRDLTDVMAICRKANEVNGYIINVRRAQVRELIDVVRGGSAVTYGPQGKTFAKALRALARA
ncbi:MAG: flagella synthesis protein FlgN [Steroidobacteraceae bacterium]|jgi:flagellar biosynthesis/type III secretory pathway chaperone